MLTNYTDYQEYSDAKLVQCCQGGDGEAKNALCERYWGVLHKFFKQKIGKNNAEAKDLVQETLIEALGSLKTLSTPSSFRWWLHTIAKRVLGRWIAEKQKRREQVALDAVPDIPSERDLDPEDAPGQTTLRELFAASGTCQPEHGVLDDELGALRRCFEGTLQPKELRLFRSRHHKRMKFREIADELNMKEGTAKVQYYRLVRKFREWLERHYPEYLFLVKQKRR
ncbi:MAG: sigma-70 family RNA polymerase sigma factor [Candidatus Poribacteria bacterium]|nr:sigma-70 family RNA polymerase sigma factor [Candidatus Poribacteria bacterium]